MQRRKFIIGLGALSAGSAAAISTGAFSSVEAKRGFSVTVADDVNAYLSLDASVSDYANQTDGTLELDFSNLNKNASTMFLHLFTITNEGTNTVGIQIDRPDLPGGNTNHVNFFVGEHGGETLSAYDKDEMAAELDYANPGADPRVLEPGDDLPVGLYFLNSGEDWDEDTTFTINALDKGTADVVSS